MRAASKEPHFPSPTKNSAARYLQRGGYFFSRDVRRSRVQAGAFLLVSPHWCPPHWCPLTGVPLTGIPHWCLPWWPRDRPPDAHSQVHTLIPELTPEAGLRPRAPKLLIQVLGTPGVTMAQPQACQEASHLKTHCPLTGSCALAVGRSMGVHGLSCWTSQASYYQN